MRIRVIDAGTVSHLRSQSVYHGLAYARGDATPDTIVLATPGEPYVCIGLHQDVGWELDLEFCRRRGLPVLRRETGGGTVYLDRDQLFVQWIMGPESLPAHVEERFELFTRPLVDTYRELGVGAVFRPPNDVQVNGRKITGTGAARIGNGEVVTGNFIFDFDTDVMSKVLRAPSGMFRRQLAMALREYMTSIVRELDRSPGQGEVKSLYLVKCRDRLGAELVPGELTEAEQAAIAEVEDRFRSPEWVGRPGGMRRRGVKIHAGVSVVESVAGSIRVIACLREGRIEAISLLGVPDDKAVAAALVGVELERGPVTRAVGSEVAQVVLGLAAE